MEEPLKSFIGHGIIRKVEYSQDPQDDMGDYLEHGTLSKICRTSYHLPFDDNTFDVIFSNVVFEHIMDYSATLAEISRILKPTGINVHTFPGQWNFKEQHVMVPLASKVQYFWWLYFWALMGIRNEYQHDFSALEVAKRNYWYLHRRVNYLSRMQIKRIVSQYFGECRFAEEMGFIETTPRVWKWFRCFPFLLKIYRAWYSDTQMRMLVFWKKKSP
jgi:SAM-dependent methyltransferase